MPCPLQITPSVDNFAERLIQAVLAASETSFGMMLALFCSVQMVSGLQVSCQQRTDADRVTGLGQDSSSLPRDRGDGKVILCVHVGVCLLRA